MSIKNIFITSVFCLLVFSGCSQKQEVVQYDFNEPYNIYNYNQNKQSIDIASNNYKTQIFSQTDKNIQPLDMNKYPYELTKMLDSYLNTRVGGDCSGLVSLINGRYDNLYFNEKELNSYYSNQRKSQAMYNMYKDNQKISLKDPKVGDLVFFSSTFTKKKIKAPNPKNVTHVGIVRSVNKDGTIKFIHFSSGKAIASFMNLRQKDIYMKDDKVVNSYITRCSSSSCLASNRFIGFGKVDWGEFL